MDDPIFAVAVGSFKNKLILVPAKAISAVIPLGGDAIINARWPLPVF